MEKNVLSGLLLAGLFIAVLSAGFVLAASEKSEIAGCSKNCTSSRVSELNVCQSQYKDCKLNCTREKKSCLNASAQEFKICRQGCDALAGKDKIQCKMNCSKEKIKKADVCSKRKCFSGCFNSSSICKQEAKDKSSACMANCTGSVLSEAQCEASGGFHYKLCNGPYFDIVCSQNSYCICNGFGNYTCPANYSCSQKIKNLAPRKANTIAGYKDLLGNDLGSIGVCEKIKN